MSEAYLAVQYIGGLDEYRDNVIHSSGRVWKRFSSVRIPQEDVDKYILRHPDMFRLLHPIYLESDHAAILSKEEQVEAMLGIVGNLEKHAAEEVLQAVQERLESFGDRPSVVGNLPREDKVRFNERRQKIADVIAALDKKDEQHFTTTGKPRVSVVQALTELPDVSGAEIEEVLRQMKLAEAAT